MEHDFEMYSNERFSRNLKDLINNSSYDLKEISGKLQTHFGNTISVKQLTKYLKGTATPRADSLYLLADLFDVSIDALVGRCDLDGYYSEKDNPNFNKFHLDSNSRYKLSEMENETEINVLNKVISKSNLINIFTAQLENATTQLKTVTDNETREDVIFLASHKVQIEIDKLFKKCLNESMKR